MKRAAMLLLASVSCWACAGTETGNPSFDGTLGYDAYSSRPAEVGLRANAVTRVDSAWFVLGDVSFASSDDCSEPSAHVDGLGAGDHVDTQAPATPITLGSGRYCTVGVRLEHAGAVPAGAPESLAGLSIVLRGSHGDGLAFELASAYRGELSMRSREGFELNEMESGVLVGFDLASWLADLDWDGAAAVDGVIRIDASHNPSLLGAFEARIAGGVALFRDSDGDGVLDQDATPLASGSD